ncbi:MAG: hypothetical protein JWR18_609 [Segetibacter sp.]|jgi:hypothetical protein|nr:hypothetical protein [Segetibacter sp.]
MILRHKLTNQSIIVVNTFSIAKALGFLLAFFFFYLIPLTASSQQINPANDDIDTTDKKDIIDVFKSTFKYSPARIKRRSRKKVYFSLLPTSGAVPGGGKALITSTAAGFYLGSRRNTSLSTVNFIPYLNFKGRYSIAFRNNIYTNKNKWNVQGETRFSLFPEYVYGTSATNQSDQRLLISYKYFRFYQTVLKQVKPYLLVGMGYNLDYHVNVETVGDTIALSKFIGYDHGTAPHQNSVSSGITFNLLYDSRNNSINPLPGAYFNLIYRINPSFLGNGDNSWKSVYLDARKYISLPGDRRHMVALWSYLWTSLNNRTPYLDLPAIGYEPYQRSGRGIQQNRYRGKSLFYFESEYRSDLRDDGLLGYVVFFNTNTTTNPANGNLSGPHPAIGAGLRVKFNKRSNTNIAIDYAVSKGYSTLMLNLGEAF